MYKTSTTACELDAPSTASSSMSCVQTMLSQVVSACSRARQARAVELLGFVEAMRRRAALGGIVHAASAHLHLCRQPARELHGQMYRAVPVLLRRGDVVLHGAAHRPELADDSGGLVAARGAAAGRVLGRAIGLKDHAHAERIVHVRLAAEHELLEERGRRLEARVDGESRHRFTSPKALGKANEHAASDARESSHFCGERAAAPTCCSSIWCSAPRQKRTRPMRARSPLFAVSASKALVASSALDGGRAVAQSVGATEEESAGEKAARDDDVRPAGGTARAPPTTKPEQQGISSSSSSSACTSLRSIEMVVRTG